MKMDIFYGLVLRESSHRDGFVAHRSSASRSKRVKIRTRGKHNGSLFSLDVIRPTEMSRILIHFIINSK